MFNNLASIHDGNTSSFDLKSKTDLCQDQNKNLIDGLEAGYRKSAKILLIEDTPLIQKINIMLLTSLGCRVSLAKNGQEAINMSKGKFDLILLDLGLPDIDGIEVVKSIRANEGNASHIPIVAITANGNIVKERCLTAGVDDFYVKPALLEDFASIIKKWIPK